MKRAAWKRGGGKNKEIEKDQQYCIIENQSLKAKYTEGINIESSK